MTKNLTTYDLYHHQPDPLLPTALDEQAWLVNNAVTYGLVASIEAQTPAEALLAAQRTAKGEHAPRPAVITAGNLLRETLPGDILVNKRTAWMLQQDGSWRPLTYACSPAWKTCPQQYPVSSLAWSRDGQMLVAAEEDHQVVLHPLHSDEPYPRGYTRDRYATTLVAWSPCEERIASGGYHGEVHIWMPAPWRSSGHRGSFLVCCLEEDTSPALPLTALTWTNEGAEVYVGYRDGRVVSFDAWTGVCRSQFDRPPQARAITALAFSPGQDSLLLVASADGAVRLWDCRAHREIAYYQHDGAALAACWSPQAELIASCAQDDPALHLWNPRTGELLERILLSLSTTRPLTTFSLAFSPDGRYLAAGNDDGTIQLVEVAQRRHVWTYRASADGAGEVRALAWSPDGALLAAGGQDRYGGGMTDIWQARRDLETALHPVAASQEQAQETHKPGFDPRHGEKGEEQAC